MANVKNRYYQKYSQLTDKQKERAGSKADFRQRKQELGLKGVNVEKDTKTRMAGDALNQMRSRGREGVKEGSKYNQETVDSMNQQVYGVENINDFDASASGRGSLKNENRLSKADIKGLRKEGGFNRKQILQYVEDNPEVASDGQAAQNLLNKYKDRIKANQEKEETPASEPVTPTPTPESTEERKVAIGGGFMGDDKFYTSQNQDQQTEVIASGDNSNAAGGQQVNTAPGGGTIATEIAGSNNSVTNTQNIDNSVDNSRSYGGSTRVFNYTGGSNPATDTPVSAATMAGFYDVDDSPAANASRLDRQIDSNRQGQQYYSDTSHIAQGVSDRAANNRFINPSALDERIAARTQNSFDQSKLMGNDIFGDMMALKPVNYNSPKDPEKVEQPSFKVEDFINF